MNGDGFAEVAVGAPYSQEADSLNGAIYQVLGAAHLEGGSLSDADVRWNGTAEFELVGYSLAGVGDVNGDGLDDLLVGAQGGAPPATQSDRPGRAALFRLAGELRSPTGSPGGR